MHGCFLRWNFLFSRFSKSHYPLFSPLHNCAICGFRPAKRVGRYISVLVHWSTPSPLTWPSRALSRTVDRAPWLISSRPTRALSRNTAEDVPGWGENNLAEVILLLSAEHIKTGNSRYNRLEQRQCNQFLQARSKY